MYHHFFMLIVLVFFVKISKSSHFRGGIMMWKPAFLNNTMAIIDLTIKLGWRRDASLSFYCDENNIRNGTKEIGELGLNTTNGILLKKFNGVYCTDFSSEENWSYGEITLPVKYDYPYTGVKDLIYYSGGYWIPLLNGGTTWNLIATVNLDINNRTKKINQSPITSMSPIIRVPVGCYQEIKIPTEDPDGDLVKCRWSQGTECGDSCFVPSTIQLDKTNCILKLNLTKTIGFYGLRIHIEDFYDENSSVPLSSIPLEFLIEANNSTNCNNRPTFQYPTKSDGTCLAVPLNSTYSDTIVVNSNDAKNIITEIKTVSLPGLIKSPLMTYLNQSTVQYINISLVPKIKGVNIICFIGITKSLFSTDQRCISIAAGFELPVPIKISLNPTGFLYTNQTRWTFIADQDLSRPRSDVYFRFYQNNTGLEVYKANAANLNEVLINGNKIEIITQTFLKDNTDYYITFDYGVLTGLLGCQLSSYEILSPDFWKFSVRNCLTCPANSQCIGPNQCGCSNYYTGPNCDIPICDFNCNNNGICRKENFCECNFGYTGKFCDKPYCSNSSCSNHGTCENIDSCKCDPYWSGDNCDTPLCDQNCSNNGICVDANKCQCFNDFTGDTCNFKICYNLDDCSNHGICTNGACECDSGYNGTKCEINICTSYLYNCSNHGVCSTNGTICECFAGWESYDCSKKTKDCDNCYEFNCLAIILVCVIVTLLAIMCSMLFFYWYKYHHHRTNMHKIFFNSQTFD